MVVPLKVFVESKVPETQWGFLEGSHPVLLLDSISALATAPYGRGQLVLVPVPLSTWG